MPRLGGDASPYPIRRWRLIAGLDASGGLRNAFLLMCRVNWLRFPVVLCFLGAWLRAAAPSPVVPDASPEARALLQLLYDISGKHTLTGQHNYPNTRDRNSVFAAKYLGAMPAVFGSDMGHAKAGDSDSYLARPDIVQECIRQHRAGSLVTLCWHAVPPTADEPITFQKQPGADPKALKSVQGQLLDEQFRELLTPGTPLHTKWEQQVDAIAGFLKQLRDAHVPVLWRPYHEMNGDWFWWGGRGPDTAALYRMMFDRYTQVHHLNNLIWVWSVDRVHGPKMEHAKYFPGLEYADVLALDVYSNDFAQSYYDSLVTLAQGKPLALAEVGNPPSPEILAKQPRWAWYMTWAGMVRNTPMQKYDALFADPRVVNRDDAVYAQLTSAYRTACDLSPLVAKSVAADCSGRWVLDEDRSTFGDTGAATLPAVLDLRQDRSGVTVRSTVIREWGDDETSEQTLRFAGPAAESEFMGGRRTTTIKRGADGRVELESTVTLPWMAPPGRATSHETWSLRRDGAELIIAREAKTARGTQRSVLVYRRS